MATRLYISVTGMYNILNCSISDSHGSPTATATIQAEICEVGVGDYIEVELGYTGEHQQVFSGYVKSVEIKSPERYYTVVASNVLIRAIDFFIASTNPEEPYARSNISAEDLVEELMGLAGLTDYDGDSTSFTFGINKPVEVNLVSSYDFSKFVADLLAWHLWADKTGQVNFKDRKPYYTGGGTLDTIVSMDTLSATYSESDRDLRNRVVVYGAEGVFAEAKEASPHLPPGFFKTAVVSAPGVIDNEEMAQDAANYNLELYNRLTRRCMLSVVGNPNINARGNVEIVIPSIGVSGHWYVYGVEHSWGKDGYVTNVEARK